MQVTAIWPGPWRGTRTGIFLCECHFICVCGVLVCMWYVLCGVLGASVVSMRGIWNGYVMFVVYIFCVARTGVVWGTCLMCLHFVYVDVCGEGICRYGWHGRILRALIPLGINGLVPQRDWGQSEMIRPAKLGAGWTSGLEKWAENSTHLRKLYTFVWQECSDLWNFQWISHQPLHN